MKTLNPKVFRSSEILNTLGVHLWAKNSKRKQEAESQWQSMKENANIHVKHPQSLINICHASSFFWCLFVERRNLSS